MSRPPHIILLLPLLVLLAFPPPAAPKPAGEPDGAASPALSHALPALPSPAAPGAGRGPFWDYDIQTDQDSYEANVSDPSSPSATIRVTVKNNSTSPIPIYVDLTTSINLNGLASVEPSRVGPILYEGTGTAVVTVILPEDTSTTLVASLRIDGTCENNGQLDFKQVLLTVRQWHSVRLQNVTLSSSSPTERELLQVSARVMNRGNGPTFMTVAVFLDGKRIKARVGGQEADENFTVKLDAGKFLLLSATTTAVYGHHNFLLQAVDIGTNSTNLTGAVSQDSKMVSFFVNINFRDWTPYFMVAGTVALGVGLAAFRFRRRLAARFPRFGRAFRIRPPQTAKAATTRTVPASRLRQGKPGIHPAHKGLHGHAAGKPGLQAGNRGPGAASASISLTNGAPEAPPAGHDAARTRPSLPAKLGSSVKRAATAVGQRPLPRYISKRVSSDLQKLKSRATSRPKVQPPTEEELERLKAEKGRGLR